MYVRCTPPRPSRDIPSRHRLHLRSIVHTISESIRCLGTRLGPAMWHPGFYYAYLLFSSLLPRCHPLHSETHLLDRKSPPSVQGFSAAARSRGGVDDNSSLLLLLLLLLPFYFYFISFLGRGMPATVQPAFISSLVQSRFWPQPHKRAQFTVLKPPHVNGQANEEVDARVEVGVESGRRHGHGCGSPCLSRPGRWRVTATTGLFQASSPTADHARSMSPSAFCSLFLSVVHPPGQCGVKPHLPSQHCAVLEVLVMFALPASDWPSATPIIILRTE
ncbi:hypothetical protein LX32DRAFT_16635 [Colletotrichum zoysiae]|uniref:Uncharacterized protein n=1 Tax=Colletotrichum zoysiae TaxID=1216348 RepID=A0AAD9HD66_9PEZI|nr:hypothetical protein LX32DRAFT_16635 [Colletotrichum zoysiae]